MSWKLRDYQIELYETVWGFLLGQLASRKLFIYCHRRYGKSFVLFTIATEVGLGKAPEVWPEARRIIRFLAPTMQDLEEIYLPIAEDLYDDCPSDILPRWMSTRGRGHFHFPSTGSRLYLFGIDAKHYRKARGKRCHFAVPDEVGSCEPGHPGGIEHVVNAIVMPQTFGVNGRVVMPTTPAETPGHPSASLRAQCQAAGAFVKRTIYDTEAALKTQFGEGIVDEYAREAGGRDTATFKREYGCEEIVDDTRAIVPEFTIAMSEELVRVQPAPTFEFPVVAIDTGHGKWDGPGLKDDTTGALFGYYDFLRAKGRVQREKVLRRARTDQIVEACRPIEQELWSERELPPIRRVCDASNITLADMGSFHAYHVQPPHKDELEPMVNELRLWVSSKRLEIDPSCVALIRQLSTGIWDTQRKSFARTPLDGHFDLLAALIYFVRVLPVHTNPYPSLPAGVTEATHTILAEAKRREEATDKAIKQVFGIRKRKAVQ